MRYNNSSGGAQFARARKAKAISLSVSFFFCVPNARKCGKLRQKVWFMIGIFPLSRWMPKFKLNCVLIPLTFHGNSLDTIAEKRDVKRASKPHIGRPPSGIESKSLKMVATHSQREAMASSTKKEKSGSSESHSRATSRARQIVELER